MSPTNTIPKPYQSGRGLFDVCPICGELPFSMSLSVRGQIFCECGAELRSGCDPNEPIHVRLGKLVKKWNSRHKGQKGTELLGKAFDPCPFCGSNKLDVLAPSMNNEIGVGCKCGFRYLPGTFSIDVLSESWNSRKGIDKGAKV